MSAEEHLSQQFIDLYHHTSPKAAEQIKSTHKMTSKESGGRVFFTTHPDSEYASGFGKAQVHVQIPHHWTDDGKAPHYENTAELDDEFPSGEKHYAVKLNRLRPEHFK